METMAMAIKAVMSAFIKITAALGNKLVVILMEKLHMTNQDIQSVFLMMAPL